MKSILLITIYLSAGIVSIRAQILYDVSFSGGNNGGGAIIKFIPANNNLIEAKSFESASYPRGGLTQAGDGKLYGTTGGGGTGYGVIYSYDPSSSTYTKLKDFEATEERPGGNLMQATDGKFYGMTPYGGSGNGVIFSIDPATFIITKLVVLGISSGDFPMGGLMQAGDGKLYGMTKEGGDGDGVIFSYDPASSKYTKLLDFGGACGANPHGSLIQASDGKLYGMTNKGGGNGNIFSYDPSTSTCANLKYFDGYRSGAYPAGSLIQASDGKLYGTASYGGSLDLGIIFSYDISSSSFKKLKNFDGINGSHPGDLVQASDGKLYGMTSEGGSFGYGVIFSYDPSSSMFVKLKDYDSAHRYRGGKFIEIKDLPPFIALTTPANNATYGTPAIININASAVDADGSIRYVQFYNGATLLATDSTSPYSYIWKNVEKGTYLLTAKAVDNSDQATVSDSVHILVDYNKAPSVSISAPVDNAIYTAPATITLEATAADTDGTITRVRFYNGGILLGIDSVSPYSCTLTNLAAGRYSFNAKATDNSGVTGFSATVAAAVLTRPNIAPEVKITSPGNNQMYAAPASITIDAAASDSDGTITKVRFYYGGTLLCTDSVSPYSCTLNNLAAGKYSFNAKATDNNGLTSFSATVAAGVAVILNKAPVVKIINPGNNLTYAAPANITITAAASDSDGTIAHVNFYNGGTLLTTDSTAPYSFLLPNATVGNYSFVAKATDNKGLASSSASVATTVLTAPNKAPLVSITSPHDNTVYKAPATITLNAAASDTDGTITSVKFSNGGTLLYTDSSSPYIYTSTNVAAGNYSFIAKATDNKGLSASSASIAVLVIINKAPTVTITKPADGGISVTPATINLEATAHDSDGSISKVDFFSGSTLLITERKAPYTFQWQNVPPGAYTLTAVATDNSGTVTTSAPVNLSVALNKSPAVSIIDPPDEAGFTAPATINIEAAATDEDGTITKVNLYNGTALLATESNAPYNYQWQNVPVGAYVLTAVATDDKGAVTTSAPVKVDVTLPNGIASSEPVTVNSKSGINGTISLILAPNPAKNIVNIYTTGLQKNKQTTLSVISATGVIIKTIRVAGAAQTVPLDVSSLVSGVYIVKLTSGNEVIYRRFVNL